MQTYSLSQFNFDEDNRIFLNPAISDFNYSDGDSEENKIYSALSESTDRSCFSEELISRIIDWPTEYHFSPVRHNLLRHLNFKQSDRILELGCGCGAITRQLGETLATVTSVEGSVRRAKCAALRCRDLENVSIYVSNFQNVKFEQEFDYVTLIGVLEYSSIFFNSDHPFEECLKIAKSALKPEGKLIIAIENKLGLKYFNGLDEDHEGKAYFGISSLYNSSTASTFGRKEISDLLLKSGFKHSEFQYPFPDYKMPSLVLKDETINSDIIDILELLRPLKARNYGSSFTGNFEEGKVWPALHLNGVLRDFSNSFLIITSRSEFAPDNSDLVAVKYATDRRVSFMTRTDFNLDEQSGIIVRKRLLDVKKEITSGKLNFINRSHEKYIKGTTLEQMILLDIGKEDLNMIKKHIKLWLDHIEKNGISKFNHEDKYRSVLKSEYIDCLPSNIIFNESRLEYIDIEWSYNGDFTMKFLFYKFWRNLLQFEIEFFKSIYGLHKDYFIKWAEEFKIHFSKAELADCESLYNEICSIVYYEQYETRRSITTRLILQQFKNFMKKFLPPILVEFVKK